MADPQQLEILRQGADAWNAWRHDSSPAYVNLRDEALVSANLASMNLTDVDLTGTNLTGANLTGANLRQALLDQADLRIVDFRNAVPRGENVWTL